MIDDGFEAYATTEHGVDKGITGALFDLVADNGTQVRIRSLLFEVANPMVYLMMLECAGNGDHYAASGQLTPEQAFELGGLLIEAADRCCGVR